MIKNTNQTISMLIKEFEIIKASLTPILKEVKKIKETEIKLNEVRKNFESKFRKVELEIRHLNQRNYRGRDIAVIKGRVDKLSKEINIINAKKDSEIKRLKVSPIDVKKIREHEEQIVGEINKHKKAILKLTGKIEDLAAVQSKMDKKQYVDIGNIRDMIHKLEKEALMQKDLSVFKKEIKENITEDITKCDQRLEALEGSLPRKAEISKEIKDILAQELKNLSSENEKMKDQIGKFMKELNRINIKVDSTSRIISEMEKVL